MVTMKYLVDECPEHKFVWLRDERGWQKQPGDYVIEEYFCVDCGLMQKVFNSLEENTND